MRIIATTRLIGHGNRPAGAAGVESGSATLTRGAQQGCRGRVRHGCRTTTTVCIVAV